LPRGVVEFLYLSVPKQQDKRTFFELRHEGFIGIQLEGI